MAVRVVHLGIGEAGADRVGRKYEMYVVSSLSSSKDVPISDNHTIRDFVEYVIYSLYPTLAPLKIVARYKDFDNKTMVTVPEESWGLQLLQVPFVKQNESDEVGRQFLEIIYLQSKRA
jgi:hypothetical protein